jgi:hypothetical protein
VTLLSIVADGGCAAAEVAIGSLRSALAADRHSEQVMLRWTVALFFAGMAVQPALGTDQPAAHHARHRPAVILPAGLPRPHYHFRTTISYDLPYKAHRHHHHRFAAHPPLEVLVAPVYVGVPYIIPVLIGAPWLPVYSDGSEIGYWWDRLPYDCGVYGYC